VVALDLAIVQWKKSNEMSLLDSYERLTFSWNLKNSKGDAAGKE
jgi:hypothetical protein